MSPHHIFVVFRGRVGEKKAKATEGRDSKKMIVWIKTAVKMTEEDQKQQGSERKQQSGESNSSSHYERKPQSISSELKTLIP
jgi:hypothetical protein